MDENESNKDIDLVVGRDPQQMIWEPVSEWFVAALEMVDQSGCPICGWGFSIAQGKISCANCTRAWDYIPYQSTADETKAKSLSLSQPLLYPPPISNQVLILDANRIPIASEPFLGPAITRANSLPSAHYLVSALGIIHIRVGILSDEDSGLPVWDTIPWEDFFRVLYSLESTS